MSCGGWDRYIEVKDEEKVLGDSGERAQNSRNILEKRYRAIKCHSNYLIIRQL